MSRWHNRYLQGFYQEVYDELLEMQEQVFEDNVYDEVLSVARAIMQRVRHNIELLISDLAGHRLLAPFTLDGAQEMTWSPDGRTLAMVEENGDVLLVTLQQQVTGQLIVTRTRTLAVDTAPDERALWSPSGRWLLCRHQTYESENYLFLLAADGSGKQVKLTSSTTDGQVMAVAWSPDGKQLIVSQVSDGTLMLLNITEVLKTKGVKP